ncbi:MAG: BatD protein [Bacteroidetes bacterium HGW-Bacteroidetes-9]|nr:MAG: BatD protein [Bacteroidetes bacterium HGW-Bacteroidetes-9]
MEYNRNNIYTFVGKGNLLPMRLSIVVLMLLTALQGFAQDIELKASAREVVSVGDQFRLVFSINAQASGFTAPVLKDFNILAGPSQSSSSSMQIINNQVTRSVDFSFTYILQASKEGTFTITPASVNVDGKIYKSNPLTIKVVKGNAPPPQQGGQSNQQPSGDISSKDLFVRASVNKSNPYQGEQVIVTYKIYTRVPIAEYSVTKAPGLSGFWTQDLLKDSKNLNQYRETIDGQEYVVAEIKKDAMFAQKSGNLTIEPLEMDVVAQIQRKSGRRPTNDPFFDSFFNDSFFGNTMQNVKKTIRSNQLTINVKPLPSQGRPVDFTGAAGNYTIAVSTDRTELKANDAMSLKFTITGKGNLKLIEKPALVFPSDFEVYDPRITDNINITSSGVSGSRTFEYLIIPRNPGNFKIKPASFSYFDIDAGVYKTLNSQEFNIKVNRSDGSEGTFTAGGTNKEDFKYIGSDIRFIKTGVMKLRPVNTFLFGSPSFWMLLAAPVLLFILFLVIWRNELKKRSNQALMRNRKATGVSRKRLKMAEKFMKQGDHEHFWAETSNALWGYMSDKFNIPRSTLSMDSAADALNARKVNAELSNQFISTLNNCEFARFAPGDKSQAMGDLYKQALDVITRTEQELK